MNNQDRPSISKGDCKTKQSSRPASAWKRALAMVRNLSHEDESPKKAELSSASRDELVHSIDARTSRFVQRLYSS